MYNAIFFKGSVSCDFFVRGFLQESGIKSSLVPDFEAKTVKIFFFKERQRYKKGLCISLSRFPMYGISFVPRMKSMRGISFWARNPRRERVLPKSKYSAPEGFHAQNLILHPKESAHRTSFYVRNPCAVQGVPVHRLVLGIHMGNVRPDLESMRGISFHFR